jgi:2-polyprenyl-3-methyl-5-hydroxy-6-metoxy-1,4-benzoquinol methylase
VKTFRAWYKEIAGCLKTTGGTALDIGCAAGYFLQILQEMGWQAEGIELEREMRGTVSDKGFTVYDTPLEFFEPRKKYSLITLFDVFEHLPNLHRNIEKLTSILDAQGSIALVTPDFNSFQRKVFSRRWFQYKPREHIQYFTLETLRRAVTGHGLKIVHHSSCGQYADTTFLYNRLKRYGFTPMADVFNLCVSLLRLGNKSWYADTGSMLAVLQKKD